MSVGNQRFVVFRQVDDFKVGKKSAQWQIESVFHLQHVTDHDCIAVCRGHAFRNYRTIVE
jgi:hypothetical protein